VHKCKHYRKWFASCKNTLASSRQKVGGNLFALFVHYKLFSLFAAVDIIVWATHLHATIIAA
jgi:hypothetical protein